MVTSFQFFICRQMSTKRVPATGIEPVASGFGNQHSIQLSYAGNATKIQK